MSLFIFRRGAVLPPNKELVFKQLPELRDTLRRFDDGDEDKPREPTPIKWKCQIAAWHEISLGVMNGMIARGEAPAPPETRYAGDGYEKLFARWWMQLPPERRAALQAASLRDYSVVEDEEEPQARRSRRRRCSSAPPIHVPRLDGLPKNNTSGFRGVSRCGSRWIAQIFIDGAIRRLGRFDSAEDAAAAYSSALAQRQARKG